jgi:hypothetical protein
MGGMEFCMARAMFRSFHAAPKGAKDQPSGLIEKQRAKSV